MLEIDLGRVQPYSFKLHLDPSKKVELEVILSSENHIWPVNKPLPWLENEYLPMVIKSLAAIKLLIGVPLLDDSSSIRLPIGSINLNGQSDFVATKRYRSYPKKEEEVKILISFYPRNRRYNGSSNDIHPDKYIEMHLILLKRLKEAFVIYKDYFPSFFVPLDLDATISLLENEFGSMPNQGKRGY